MTDRPGFELEHYSYLNRQVLFRTEQISKAFELYTKLFTALVAATGGLLLAGQVEGGLKAMAFVIIAVLTGFLGYTSVKVIEAHQKLWAGFRDDQRRFGPRRFGVPMVPPHDDRPDIRTHSFQTRAIALSSGGLVLGCVLLAVTHGLPVGFLGLCKG